MVATMFDTCLAHAVSCDILQDQPPDLPRAPLLAQPVDQHLVRLLDQPLVQQQDPPQDLHLVVRLTNPGKTTRTCSRFLMTTFSVPCRTDSEMFQRRVDAYGEIHILLLMMVSSFYLLIVRHTQLLQLSSVSVLLFVFFCLFFT